MSIFKCKVWWSNDTSQHDNETAGIQNCHSLKVNKFNSHSDSDCIILCEDSNLKIYKPLTRDFQGSHIVLEKQLDNFVLHVDIGKFTMNSEDQQIIVLHSQSYSIYALQKKDGHIEAGEQNMLNPILTNKVSRKAHSLTCGHFGNVKSRDLVCVQGLDGSLSIFDQDTFLFICELPTVIIPGVMAYITSCDSFVICNATWIMEIYSYRGLNRFLVQEDIGVIILWISEVNLIFSYQQLQEFSESNVRQNKKNVAQWTYNAGEEIASIQVIQTSNNFSSILALGERYLYCFQDNGLMKFMMKFDFMPMCFHAYLIGWYYEPGARLLVMVASDDSKLFIYENTTLLWACDLLSTPLSISRCFLKGLSGGLVTLSVNGVVNVSYIGTEPDLTGFGQAMLNEPSNPETVQSELEIVEETLQKIMNNDEDADEKIANDDIVRININIGKPIQNLYEQSEYFEAATLHLLMCPFIINMTFDEPSFVKSLQITYSCQPPFTCSDTTISLDSVNGTEIIDTSVFLSSDFDTINTYMTVLFTITNGHGKLIVIPKIIALPLNLFTQPVENLNDFIIKLVIETENKSTDLLELFPDFHENKIARLTSTDITLGYRASKKQVRISTTDNGYCLEARDYTDIIAILENFMNKLKDYNTKNGNEFEYRIKIDKDFASQLIHRFLKCIESHAKARIKLKKFEDDLDVLQKQFTLIQKRLLVQYGSLPPGDCDPLEFLMKDTYKRLVETTNEIISNKETVCRAGNSMTAVGNLVIYLLQLYNLDTFKVKLIEEMLTLNCLYENYQDWEEAVSQSISYILNNVFTKSEKDKGKLTPVTEQGILSHINLKRFLKQVRLILDRMFAEALDIQNKDPEIEMNAEHKTNLVRLEEFVEVI